MRGYSSPYGPPPFLPAKDVLGAVPASELAPLVGSATHAHLLGLAEQIPLSVQTACYECWLSEEDTRVDLAFCLLPQFGRGGVSDLRRRHGGDRAWARSIDLLQAWTSPERFDAEPSLSLRASVPFVWMAFDLERKFSELPPPCIGVCADRDFFARRLGAPPQPSTSASDLEALADHCYLRLHDVAMPEACRGLLRRCLGERVDARHFSYMLSRDPPTFKLDVQLRVEAVGGFLEAIGWPGPARRIQASLRELMPWEGHVQLNLVLHPELRPPLEVEFLTLPTEVDSAGRFAFLDRLVDGGLCGRDKADVLRSLWSYPLGLGASEGRVGRSWYVKARFREDRPYQAKAYVGLIPRLGSGLSPRLRAPEDSATTGSG